MDLTGLYSRLYLGVVYDAMRFDLNVREPFVVHRAIKPIFPLRPGEVLFGHAFTCRGERVQDPKYLDDTVRLHMFQRFTRGCVQVIDAGDDTVAHFGDISGKLARKFGAVGAVIDGTTRDARILEEDRFMVFCRGAQPLDAYGRWQIAEYQVPISLEGPEGRVRVSPGDAVFGDPDGVVVIPEALAEQVGRLATERLHREELIRRELASADDVESLYSRLGRW